LEIPFAFDTLDCCTGPNGFAGENPPQALADRVHGIWVEFARSGALAWAEYEPKTREVFRLAKGVAEVDLPMPAERFGA
jgi:para-nitrobenzyl esterase